MVRDHLAAAIGLHLVLPGLFGGGQALVEILEALLEVSGVGGIQLSQLVRNAVAIDQ